MTKLPLLSCFLAFLVCGCAQKNTATTEVAPTGQTATAQNDSSSESKVENAEKAAKVGAKVVIMKVAGTPVKVLSAVGTAAGVVKKKVEGEDSANSEANASSSPVSSAN